MIAPLLAALVITVVVAISATTAPGSAELPTMMIGGFVLGGLSIIWYALANMMALYRVLTDPGNEHKMVWALGWAFANLVMHVAFVYLYVMKGGQAEDLG
jgi:hypothetical protein